MVSGCQNKECKKHDHTMQERGDSDSLIGNDTPDEGEEQLKKLATLVLADCDKKVATLKKHWRGTFADHQQLRELMEQMDWMRSHFDSRSNRLARINKAFELLRSKFKDGVQVTHTAKGFTGTVDGTTQMRKLFETPNSDCEYRIRLENGDIKIADGCNLVAQGQRRVSYCYKCKSYIGPPQSECTRCGWYKCDNCDACGCMYQWPQGR